MYKLVIAICVFLISCNDYDKSKKTTLKNSADSTLSIVDSDLDQKPIQLIFDNDLSKIDPSFSFNSAVFDFGESSYFSGCDFDFGCDCCSGNLVFYSDSVYYYIDDCMSDLSISKGRFTIDKNKLTLVSKGITVDKKYDDASRVQLSDTVVKPHKMTFDIKSCNGKVVLVNNTDNEIWIGLYKNANSDIEVRKLKEDGIIDRLNSRE